MYHFSGIQNIFFLSQAINVCDGLQDQLETQWVLFSANSKGILYWSTVFRMKIN